MKKNDEMGISDLKTREENKREKETEKEKSRNRGEKR